MWNCGVTIVICVMTKVYISQAASITGYNLHGPLRLGQEWLNYEDDDYYPRYTYIYSQGLYLEEDEAEDDKDDTPTIDEDTGTTVTQFNDDEMEYDVTDEPGQYNNTDEWQYNNTDFTRNDDYDQGVFNQTELEDKNTQIGIERNQGSAGQNLTGAQTLAVPSPTTRKPTALRPPPTTRRPPPTTRRPPPTTRRPPPTTRRPPPTTRRPPPPPPPPPRTPPLPSPPLSSNSLLYELRMLTGRRDPKDYELSNAAEGNGDNCTNKEICARKCCPEGTGYNIWKNGCRDIPDRFHPPLWTDYLSETQLKAIKEIRYLNGQIHCEASLGEELTLVTDITRYFYVNIDGTLFVESYQAMGPELIFDTNKYCIDRFITADEKTEWNAHICYVNNRIERKYVLTGSCMLITCFLVLLRVVAFAWLPELRTLHGMILMAYLVSFLVGFLLLGSKMLLMYDQNINREACVVLAYIVYFSILSAFFWRNIMCYDIWWTFSGKRARSSRSSASRTRLYLYCAYAFGGPTALTILLTTLEVTDVSTDSSLMPKMWRHGCNSLFGYHKLIYFYGPIIILFVINIIFFTLTALKIAAIKRETKMIFKSGESGTTHDEKTVARQRFILYVKLFATMVFLEVNWILEIISIFYPQAEIVLIITDAYNVIILLVILVNFLFQKQTWRMIKKRYRQLRRLPTPGRKPAENKFDTKSTDFSREKSNLAESQDDTHSTDFSREKTNFAGSEDDTHSTDFSREKANFVGSEDDTQSTDFSREKANLAECEDDTQSTDFSREKANLAERKYDTQSTDFSREKANLAESQDDTQSTDFSREKANLAESQDDTQSTDFSREKANLAESQDDTQSTDSS